jgi:PAS domain S-box-containing protein
MEATHVIDSRMQDENAILRSILEGTATVTGKHFFRALVENLATAVKAHSAWVTEYVPATRQLHALAFWSNGQISEDFFIDIDGTPCEKVIESTEIIHYPNNILRLYPQDMLLKEFTAQSYLGAPLLNDAGRVLGNLAVFDTHPMPEEPHLLAVFKIFAARASAELQRLHAEANVYKSEEKFRRIIETTGEGFVMMDKDLNVADANEAFCKMIGYPPQQIVGRSPLDFAAEDFRQFLNVHMAELFTDHHKEFEGTLVAKSGRSIPVRIYGDVLKNDRGETIGYMHFVSDLTRQKKSLILAGEVQRNLLPQDSPYVKGFDVAGRMDSCDEIGGDYFDYWVDPHRPDSRIHIVVGDVTGHGPEAALLMTAARAIFRLEASKGGDMENVINAMNRQLVQDVLDTGRFMTLFCLQIDAQDSQMQWVRAGHAPALLYTPDNDGFTELKGQGMALGVDAAYSYQVNRAPAIACGQIIAIGTDGIWEALDRRREPYGTDRLRNIIRQNAHRQASEIVDSVYDDLNRFAYGIKRVDDITLVVVKATDEASDPWDWSI